MERKRELEEIEKKRKEESRRYMEELQKRTLNRRQVNKRKEESRRYLKELQNRRQVNKMTEEVKMTETEEEF